LAFEIIKIFRSFNLQHQSADTASNIQAAAMPIVGQSSRRFPLVGTVASIFLAVPSPSAGNFLIA